MPSGPFRVGAEVHALERDAQSCHRIRAGTRDVRLDAGEILIGRGDECDVQIAERGVSRRHACIRVEDGRPIIEDLASENGTFVNGARAYGTVPLTAGDCITIGTRVLEVYEHELDPESKRHDRPTPVSGIAALGNPPVPRLEADARAAETDRFPRRRVAGIEEFEWAGRLADRVLAAGRTAAAEQILAEPIMDVLEATRGGELPTNEMIDLVGRYSLRLANATLDMRWADAAIELHLLAARPMRLEALRQLAMVRSRTRLGDDALFSRYYEVLLQRFGATSAGEQALVRLLASFVPGLHGDT